MRIVLAILLLLYSTTQTPPFGRRFHEQARLTQSVDLPFCEVKPMKQIETDKEAHKLARSFATRANHQPSKFETKTTMAVSKLVGVVLVLFVAKAHAWSLGKASDNVLSRREAIFAQVLTAGGVLLNNNVAPAFAEEAVAPAGVEVVAVGDAMKVSSRSKELA